ncbi:hypothetical protein EBS43_11515 [bacterium]|nr:hypothetical protein [bacterium]
MPLYYLPTINREEPAFHDLGPTWTTENFQHFEKKFRHILLNFPFHPSETEEWLGAPKIYG